jgi:hypothetical protein
MNAAVDPAGETGARADAEALAGDVALVPDGRSGWVRRRKLSLLMAFGSAAVIAILVVVLVVVLPGSVVATAFLGSSGTATLDIHTPGGVPMFSGSMGGKTLSGEVLTRSGEYQPAKLTITGMLYGTHFSLAANEDTSGLKLGQITKLEFNVTGTFGSDPVRGTLDWPIPPNIFSANPPSTTQMTVHATVGSHTLDASGEVGDNDTPHLIVATFHYTLS